MSEPAHLLLIGNEPAHQQSHAAILRPFWIIATSPTSSYEELLPTTDVVVLCHSLGEAERQEVVVTVNRRHRKPILVKINGYDSGPHAGIDASVDLHHGPGALVSTIYQLLTERGIPGRGWPGEDFEFAPGIH